MLDVDFTAFEFAVAQHDHVFGAQLVRIFHLRFQPSAEMVGFRGYARVPQFADEGKSFCVSGFAHRSDIDFHAVFVGDLYSQLFDKQEQPFEAEPESRAAQRGAVHGLHQAVVPAAAAYRALRADGGGNEFEHRAGIVIEPAHNIRIDFKRHAARR